MQHGYGARVAVVMATLLWVLGLWPAGAHAQSIVPPRDMLALSGAVSPGATTTLVPVGSTPAQALVVPSGQVFILTDLIIAPQGFPVVSAGDYLLQVTSSPNVVTTALSVAATATNPASLQVHLLTGMVFQAGSNVRVGLTFGNNRITVSAFGYLTTP
jgi:Tfp pilus assembly protein PilW